MAKRKPALAAVEAAEGNKPLTWQEERFVEAYIENRGNGTQAGLAAGYGRGGVRQQAAIMLTRPHIVNAIALEQERLRETLRFDREKALKILIGRATASLDDFTAVMLNHTNRESYNGLGCKRFAIKKVKQTEHGVEFELFDGMAALNELWEKLGLGKESSASDWSDGLESVLKTIERLKSQKSG
jgi:phage terminase small subunit